MVGEERTLSKAAFVQFGLDKKIRFKDE